ncbi:hypothetical protein D9619_006621 [Psilocybe cf. subviscida]|uniref:Hydrophobin n=1 Tax=Psilocybe cf. subviscida TaxID=2480587 RepID=A0A8H5EXP1_9AGAR|nr:hypothetical protein D9619_006621 [Psilocybe cf. subviscida]
MVHFKLQYLFTAMALLATQSAAAPSSTLELTCSPSLNCKYTLMIPHAIILISIFLAPIGPVGYACCDRFSESGGFCLKGHLSNCAIAL